MMVKRIIKTVLATRPLRLKYNIIGNDGSDFGLAALGFVKMPTNQDSLGNDDVEGRVEFPL